MILIDAHIAHLERRRFAPEDREPKRRIKLLRRGLVIAHREDDLFQPGQRSSPPQRLVH